MLRIACLDKFLVQCLPEFSRSRLQNLIENGFILVDGVVAYKSGQAINQGDVISEYIYLHLRQHS